MEQIISVFAEAVIQETTAAVGILFVAAHFYLEHVRLLSFCSAETIQVVARLYILLPKAVHTSAIYLI